MHDITIIYKPEDPIAYAKSNTPQGRNFLSDHVKGRRIHNTAIVPATHLLPLLSLMQQADLNIHWQEG